uniref:U2-associated protein SR140 n=1 Tax=Kwoniella bestiolae CBS 10118 TaxID=1296100 RepID=A0A1B9G754_9TREE|nr:U2-associated protein SR140 [Kwoniella bestiolae CBS 10118]OCF26858.1 U2-associated protein SR140 [Kwoniella bestiolae CBS 10118]
MPPRLDLSAFGGSDSEDESFPPKRQLELNALKSKTFSHGITKKTKKDLEREAEEKKKKEEEEALRLVNAEYEEAFEGPSSYNAPLGGTRQPGRRPMGPGGGFVKAGGAPMDMPYQPPRGPAGFDNGINQMPPQQQPQYTQQQQFQPPRGPSAMGYGRPRPPPQMKAPSPPPSSSAGPMRKGKRAMDSFLEEIKNNQNAREERLGHLAKQEGSSVSALAAWESEKGSHIVGNQETTNLFISNLPSNISEESLGLFFAKLGPIGTVKIMWPRGDEDTSVGASMTISRRSKAGLSGFVSYMKRKDAERAVREYDGLEWGGCVLRVGWSKPVPMPLRPIYGELIREKRGRSASPVKHRDSDRHRDDKRDHDDTRKKGRGRSRSRSRSRSYSPKPKSSKSKNRSARSRSYSSSSSRSPSPPPRKNKSRRSSYSSYSSDSLSRSPSPRPRKPSAKDKWLSGISEEQKKFIKTVANRVKDVGRGFEDLLRKKEKENPKFAFLVNEDLPEYHFYQLSVDPRYRIPTPPPDDFADEGYASMYSSDSAEDSEKERVVRGKLGKLARKRFEAMLRVMSGKRAEIARGMEFALKKAEAADEVAEIVCQSVRLDATPVPRKMARLHLISDILHNSASSLPNVWKYRQAFESRLPPVFSHLSTVYQSLLAYSGKISADVFKGQVVAVLEIWERWIVFNSETAEYLRGLLDGTKTLALPKDAKTKQEEKEEQIIAEQKKNEQEDSGKFKSSGFKSSFKPISASAPPPQATGGGDDLDGEAMEDDDLDGEAMDEDLDGEAM